jgi:hypothetical protein
MGTILDAGVGTQIRRLSVPPATGRRAAPTELRWINALAMRAGDKRAMSLIDLDAGRRASMAPAALSIADRFRASLAGAERRQTPFRHWLLDDALPAKILRAIASLPAPPAKIGETHGKRETHNSTRRFLAPGDLDLPVARDVAASFQDPQTVRALADATGADLAGTFLRIEYCRDTDGFWLEPHTDIGAKSFTMLIYLSDEPQAASWGTDIYDRDKRHLGAAPCGFGKGLIFVPGPDTWHGFEKRRIDGVRKSIIVNYVKPEWRARHELAFADRPVRP